MKKFLKTFILAICLILPSMFCLTACDNRKVVDISVELASGSSYTLTEGEINIEYGERVAIGDKDFVVSATMDDGDIKIISVKSNRNKNGFTLSSTIPNDDVTPIGTYTLTFGHKNLLESDYKTIKVNVVRKVVNVKSLNLTWTDDVTPIVYNGEEQTIEITSIPEYLKVLDYSNNGGTYPNCDYLATAMIGIKDGYKDRYFINGDKDSVQHSWRIEKAEISLPDIDLTDALENYTFEGMSITTKLKDEIKAGLESLNISTSLEGSPTGRDADEYQVEVVFKYTGDDAEYYNLGEGGLIGKRPATWRITPKEIDVSNIGLKVKGGNTYINAFTYDGSEKSVVFDLSSLKCDGYINDSTYPLEQGLPSVGLPSTGSEILELFEYSGTCSTTNAGTYTFSISFRISSFLDYQKNYRLKDATENVVTITKTWEIKQKELTDVTFVLFPKTFVYDSNKNLYYSPYKLVEANGIVAGDDVGVKVYALRTEVPTSGDFWAYYNTIMEQGEMGVFFDETSTDNGNYKFVALEGYSHFGIVSVCADVQELLVENTQMGQTQYYRVDLRIPIGGTALGITSSDADFSTQLFDENFNKIEYGYNQNYKEFENDSEEELTKTLYVKVNSSRGSKIIFYNYMLELYVNDEHISTICVKHGDEINVDISSKLKGYQEFDFWSLDAGGEIPATTITRSGNIYAQLKEREEYKPFSYSVDDNGAITITGLKDAYKTSTILTIPNGVVTIGDNAFNNYTALENITISNTVTKIGEYAFKSCSSLTAVNYEENSKLSSIGKFAFKYCKKLQNIIIPSSVKSIGNSAFYFDREEMSIKVYISDLASWLKIQFGGERSGEEEPRYANPLASTFNSELYLNGQLVEDLVIPVGTTEIKDYAFAGCSSIKSVTIPNTVTSIGKFAFFECSNKGFTTISIPGNVLKIGESAFHGCGSLTSVKISEGVTNIEKTAFYSCPALTQIEIPDSVLTLGKDMLSHAAISNLYYKGTAQKWSSLTAEVSITNEHTKEPTIYYYSETQPTESGNYWHYDEHENPTIWQVEETEE